MKRDFSVYECKSLGEFLRKYLKLAQEKNRRFSAAQFARKLEIAPSTLNGLIQEKADPSLSLVVQTAGKLALSESETEYLSTLVQLQKAKNRDEKKFFERKIQTFRKKESEVRVDLNRFSLVSDWYYSVLLELPFLKGVRINAEAAAKLLKIDPKIAEDALNRLHNLKWLKRDNEGYFERLETRTLVDSPEPNPAMRHYYREYLKRIDDAILNQDPDRRFSGSETLALNTSQLEGLRSLVYKFLDQIGDLPSQSADKDRIYHVAVHAFEVASSGPSKS